MKKLMMFIGLLTLGLFLIGCENTPLNTRLVVSKLYTASSMADNAIELYNNSDEDIDLKNYEFYFYTNGAKEVSVKIALEGTVKAHDYFVVASSNFSQTAYTVLVDFKYEEGSLPYNGNDAIELRFKGKLVDQLGEVGHDIDFSKNMTLIRLGLKENFEAESTFDYFNFISYLPDVFEYLKNDNYEIKTLEDLYKGPRLENRYLEMPYRKYDANGVPQNLGSGGTAKVNLSSVADGDTAFFTSIPGNDYPGGSMRYYFIDTPEKGGMNTNDEPWGHVATKYNKDYILNPSTTVEIIVQSIPDYTLTETYGRNIGLVWVNGHLSQFLTVSEGLANQISSLGLTEYDLKLTYKKVPYIVFLRFAEKRAIDNEWGTKGYGYFGKETGEKSPDWNYQNNQNATTNPNWTPHLPMPWDNN